MKDAEVLAALKKAGSQLELPHPLRHYVYVPDKPMAEAVANQIRGSGFEAEMQPPTVGTQWVVLALHRMVPSLDAIGRVRSKLEKVASDHGGEYDGWEAGVTRG